MLREMSIDSILNKKDNKPKDQPVKFAFYMGGTALALALPHVASLGGVH